MVHAFPAGVSNFPSGPGAAHQRAGIHEAEAWQALRPDAWMLDTGLPPLASNNPLTASGHSHASHVMGQLFYDSRSPEGFDPMERASALGCAAVRMDVLLGFMHKVTLMDGP